MAPQLCYHCGAALDTTGTKQVVFLPAEAEREPTTTSGTTTMLEAKRESGSGGIGIGRSADSHLHTLSNASSPSRIERVEDVENADDETLREYLQQPQAEDADA